MNGNAGQQDMARGATPSGLAQGEPGGSDNRLMLDPNDPAFEFAKEWEDGKTYTLANVQVTQVSPGEYEVVSAQEGKAEDESAEPQSEDGAMGEAGESPNPDTTTRGGSGYRNPAIASLMASAKD